MKKNDYFQFTETGFTLIELLISVAIVAVLAIISTQLLFDTISVNSKQSSLQTSSDAAYAVMDSIAFLVKEAKNIEIKPGGQEIDLTLDSDCVIFRYNAGDKTIEKASDPVATCSPVSFSRITPDNFVVDNLQFSPEGSLPENVGLLIEGEIKDSFGDHPFKYETNVFPRVGL